MIKAVIRSYLINIFALWATAQYIGSLRLPGDWQMFFLLALGFTALHLLVKPVLKIFLGPINFLSLGLVDLLLDGGILYLLTYYFPFAAIIPWIFPGLTFEGIIIPAIELNVITGAIAAALVINIIRGGLLVLVS